MPMPDFPIIDTHLHLWDPLRFRMPWLDGNTLLNKAYDLATYDEHTSGLSIASMVYLQVDVAPPYALLEAAWVVDLAKKDQRLQGIVPWAPLEYGEHVRAFLEALTALDPRIKGVRRIVQSEPELDFCLQPGFVRGTQILSEYGLSCDLGIHQGQLPATVELVRRCPETSFVLDHLGKPNIKDRALDPWRQGISELAALPNVCCKVSGIVTEADHQHWAASDLQPFLDHALAAFGEDRVLFGGDWPVALSASPYSRWVEALYSLTQHLTPQAQRKLWYENGRRVYRLP